jgi:hypothetical protein
MAVSAGADANGKIVVLVQDLDYLFIGQNLARILYRPLYGNGT